MNVTKKIKVDLQNPGSTPIVYAVQTDSNVRDLEFELYNNRKAFRIPKDVQVIIRYRKFDGSGGEYDTLPDDTPAWHIQQNRLHLTLVPQVLASPGSVSLTVTLISAGQQISIFPVQLNVDGISAVANAKSENYFYVTGFLPAPKQAEIGQYLCVSDVSSTGKVTAVEAVSSYPSSGGTIDENAVHEIVDSYLAENPPVTEESDPTVPDWAKQPEKPTYTAQEVGAQPAGAYLLETELPGIITDTLAQAQESGKFDGAPGIDGKSAYAYAQDGGYVGTEAEFAAKLSLEIPTALPNPHALTINGQSYDGSDAIGIDVTPFVITVTGNDTDGYTLDKTGEEIHAAYNAGRRLCCNVRLDSYLNFNDSLPLLYRRAVRFPITSGTATIHYVYAFSYETDNATRKVSFSVRANNKEVFDLAVTTESNYNKFPLTINDQEYDGSKAVTVETRDFLFTATGNMEAGYTIDTTYDVIMMHIAQGQSVKCLFNGEMVSEFFLPLLTIENDMIGFGSSPMPGMTIILMIMADGSILGEEIMGAIQINEQMYDFYGSADFTDTINGMIDAKAYNHPSSHPASMITGLATVATSGKYSDLSGTPTLPTVPSALKNPYALTVGETTYDGSAAVDMTEAVNALIDSRNAPETDLVLSDNLFDKSTAVTGSIFYHSSSGPSLTTASGGFYAYVPLRGAGTYCAFLNWINHGSSYATRVPILKEDKSFLQNVTGTITDIDGSYGYLKFTVTESMIENGAALYAFDGSTTTLDSAMIVKDREYPSEYIPYGYIEVEVEGGSEVSANNVLSGKTAVFLGDSICAGTTVGDNSEYYGYGWAGLIGERNAMIWKNYGRNGGTITPLSSVDTARWVPTQADSAFAAYPNADYVIFEGGCNDADTMQDALLGEISSDYATFDETTFSGAFESLVLKLLSKFPTAKIGYVIPQKMNAVNDHSTAGHVHRRFFDRAIEICEKWGIPYIDLWKCNPLNPKLSTASRFYTDGQHLTLEGYQRITPQIEAFMRSL